VGCVDELAAAFANLVGEESTQRRAPPSGAEASLIDGGDDATIAERVGAGKTREARADDADTWCGAGAGPTRASVRSASRSTRPRRLRQPSDHLQPLTPAAACRGRERDAILRRQPSRFTDTGNGQAR
jgi:hypothetical protein